MKKATLLGYLLGTILILIVTNQLYSKAYSENKVSVEFTTNEDGTVTKTTTTTYDETMVIGDRIMTGEVMVGNGIVNDFGEFESTGFSCYRVSG